MCITYMYIVHGFVKKWGFEVGNGFMLEYTSICPETTHQKLESQLVYLTLLTMDLYVNI